MFSKTKPMLWRVRWLLPVVVVVGLIMALLPSVTGPTIQAAPSQQTTPNLTWSVVLDRSASPTVYWFTVVFPTSEVGYAVGSPDWIADNPGPSTLAKTTDGGLTWTTSTLPLSSGSRTVRGLACKDANTCFVAGNSWPKLLSTADGGSNWTSLESPYSGSLWSAAYTGLGETKLAGTTGYFSDGGPGRLGSWIRAANGINFSLVAPPDLAGIVQWDIECPVPGECYSASNIRAYHTTNDGVSWVRRSLPAEYATRYYGLSCTNATTCWMVGTRQRIIRTTDSGVNWQAATMAPLPGSFPRFYDVDMVDSQHGYAVGCASTPAENDNRCMGGGMIFRTDDGMNWNPISKPAPDAGDLMDIHAFSMDDIIVLEYTGRIFRGTSAPPTAVTLSSLGTDGEATNAPLLPSAGAPLVALFAVSALVLAGVYVRNLTSKKPHRHK